MGLFSLLLHKKIKKRSRAVRPDAASFKCMRALIQVELPFQSLIHWVQEEATCKIV